MVLRFLDGVSAPNGGGLRQEFYNRLGTAYVFERDEQGRFVETRRLAHEDPVVIEEFGRMVAVDGLDLRRLEGRIAA